MRNHTFVKLSAALSRVLRITCVLMLSGLWLATATEAVAQTGQFTLLHIGDTHSHLAAWGPKDAMLDGKLGGLPKVAAIVAEERKLNTQALFVHAGDVMEGDLFFKHFYGIPELQQLKSLGLDVLVLGNGDAVPAGPVVGADIFRAMSYSEFASFEQPLRAWPLFTFRVTGAVLLKALEATLYFGDDYFPQVSGMRLDYDSSAPVGAMILEGSVHVGGNKIVKEQLYSVTATAGTYAGLQSIGTEMWDVQHLPGSAFDAIKSYVSQVGVLGLGNPNRIRDAADKTK